MTEEKKNFFCRGRFFDTEEEYFDFINHHGSSLVNEESLKFAFDELREMFKLNFLLHDVKITNNEFDNFMSERFIRIIQDFIHEKSKI